MVKNKKMVHNSKLFKFLNNPVPIIVVLMLLVIGFMFYTRFLIKNVNVYTFSGFEDNYSFLNGTIFTGHDVNYFGDTKIIYTGEDIKLKNFEIGYYIKTSTTYREISIMNGYESIKDENEIKYAKLKDILEKTNFSFTETKDDAKFLSKENIAKLDSLVFRITGTDEFDKDIEIEIPLEVTKITK